MMVNGLYAGNSSVIACETAPNSTGLCHGERSLVVLV